MLRDLCVGVLAVKTDDKFVDAGNALSESLPIDVNKVFFAVKAFDALARERI